MSLLYCTAQNILMARIAYISMLHLNCEWRLFLPIVILHLGPNSTDVAILCHWKLFNLNIQWQSVAMQNNIPSGEEGSTVHTERNYLLGVGILSYKYYYLQLALNICRSYIWANGWLKNQICWQNCTLFSCLQHLYPRIASGSSLPNITHSEISWNLVVGRVRELPAAYWQLKKSQKSASW